MFNVTQDNRLAKWIIYRSNTGSWHVHAPCLGPNKSTVFGAYFETFAECVLYMNTQIRAHKLHAVSFIPEPDAQPPF